MKLLEQINGPIKKNRILGNSRRYLICGEVHVQKGVKLTIRDGAQILIANGINKSSRLKRSALIFDRGSTLHAKKVIFRAANSLTGTAEKVADNGGIWFFGAYKESKKDGMGSNNMPKSSSSSFRATKLTTHYLGSGTISSSLKLRSKARSSLGDLDAISVMGVSREEWDVSAIKSLNSGDDGFDASNSDVVMDSLVINNPSEDGINLSSSRLSIRKKLEVIVAKDHRCDRDLFDFETDNGASYLELIKGCFLELNGVFGDQLNLFSSELQKPNTKDDNTSNYLYKGRLKKSSLIFSIDED